VQGRWLSPDPAGLGAVDPANPQTWNRYAYVGNNPLSLIDPLGADAYEGCDRNLQPWCFEGSWTAWIQGLNGMSGWGDPFRLGSIPVKVYVPGVYTRPVPLGGDTSLAIQNGVLRVQFFIPGEYVPGHYVTIGNAFTLLGPSIGQQLANNAKAASNLPTVSTNRPRDEWKPATSTTFLGKYGVQLACEFSVAVADWADNDVAAFGGFAGMAVGYLREAPVPAVGGLLLFARVTVGTALRARSTCVPIAWGPGHF